MTQVPAHLQDAATLLSETGFATSNVWYHGTSSALLESIMTEGLKGSGDQALQQSVAKTLETIGHNDLEQTKEPVFLTQSRELAYYWAQQCVRNRSVRFEGEEQPVVLALELPESLQQQVKPDVGAAAMLIARTDEYFDYLEDLYKQNEVAFPLLHPTQTDRADYLDKLGMAYIDLDIEPQYLCDVTDAPA
ncbi:hypothetical protein [Motiliproteus sediminis]|uniref:hypothetical protein n=1 Tax=Motiliproteus sediminis TaxID=1468178 RepID=UPI001AEF630F|nr:hypothetical protein [Motiliproteus sediminis]